MFKATTTLYKRVRDFFTDVAIGFCTGFAIGWKGADIREWKSINTRSEYDRNSSMTDPDIYRRLEYYRCVRCNELWPSGMKCPCTRKIENHTPSKHDDSGLMFLFGILLGATIFGDDEDEDS